MLVIFSAAKPRSRNRASEFCDSVLVLCFFCVDRGLLQLIAFCSLQVLDRSFYLCVFVCVLFLHVSAYICMFLTFSVSSFRASAALAFCKCCCRKATKILDNCARIHPKSIPNPPQTKHIGGQERSESDLESKSASSNSPGSFRKPFLAPLG